MNDWISVLIELISRAGDLILKIAGALFFLKLTIERIDWLHRFLKLRIWYPVITALDKRKHKEYVKEFLNEVTKSVTELETVIGASYTIDLEWSDEESIELDLERGMLIVRAPYLRRLEELLAKILIMISPYYVSEYLEPVLGSKLAQLLSISIAREFAAEDLNILKAFNEYLGEIYKEDPETKRLLEDINIADESSLYTHVVLREVSLILRELNGYVDKDKLFEDYKNLLEVVSRLDSIDVPIVCNNYMHLTIVRVGKLEKVLMADWDRYIEYIQNCTKKCPNLRRVYIVSAGKVITKVAEKFIHHITSRHELKLVGKWKYRARRYRGRVSIPRFIAVLEKEI